MAIRGDTGAQDAPEHEKDDQISQLDNADISRTLINQKNLSAAKEYFYQSPDSQTPGTLPELATTVTDAKGVKTTEYPDKSKLVENPDHSKVHSDKDGHITQVEHTDGSKVDFSKFDSKGNPMDIVETSKDGTVIHMAKVDENSKHFVPVDNNGNITSYEARDRWNDVSFHNDGSFYYEKHHGKDISYIPVGLTGRIPEPSEQKAVSQPIEKGNDISQSSEDISTGGIKGNPRIVPFLPEDDL